MIDRVYRLRINQVTVMVHSNPLTKSRSRASVTATPRDSARPGPALGSGERCEGRVEPAARVRCRCHQRQWTALTPLRRGRHPASDPVRKVSRVGTSNLLPTPASCEPLLSRRRVSGHHHHDGLLSGVRDQLRLSFGSAQNLDTTPRPVRMHAPVRCFQCNPEQPAYSSSP